MITGEKLGWSDRGITLICAFLPIVSAKGARLAIDGAGECAKGLEAAEESRHASNVLIDLQWFAHKGEAIGDVVPMSGKITGYTKHGLEQVMTRNGHGVKPSAILDVVKNPKNIIEKTDNLGRVSCQYRGDNSTVVLNKAGQVISAWSKNSKHWRIP